MVNGGLIPNLIEKIKESLIIRLISGLIGKVIKDAIKREIDSNLGVGRSLSL